MASRLPTVAVSHIGPGRGFQITCTACPTPTIYPTRYQADLRAGQHRASHQTPNPADQVNDLDDLRDGLR